MFELTNETITNLGISPFDINLINITYFSYKEEVLDIYETNYPFDKNIIPLLISNLENTPKLIYGKKISTIDGEVFLQYNSMKVEPTNSNYDYPSFFYDINKLGSTTPIISYRKKLVKSIEYNTNTTQELGTLVRIYNLESCNYIPSKNTFNEEEQIILLWDWEFINFQLIINKTQKTVQYQTNINITEDNKLISSKTLTVNNILDKLNKIICHISNNN
jgi:hypothetical protein